MQENQADLLIGILLFGGMENSHDGRRVAPGIMAMDMHLIELSISKHYKRSGICEIFSRFCISCAYNIANTRSLT